VFRQFLRVGCDQISGWDDDVGVNVVAKFVSFASQNFTHAFASSFPQFASP
jgi:hypothetical protein